MKLSLTWLKAIMRAVCWIVLFVGAYSANVITFSKCNSDLPIQETTDIINAKIYEMISENLLLLSCIVFSVTGLLLKLNGYEYGVESLMAIAIAIITIFSLITHLVIT